MGCERPQMRTVTSQLGSSLQPLGSDFSCEKMDYNKLVSYRIQLWIPYPLPLYRNVFQTSPWQHWPRATIPQIGQALCHTLTWHPSTPLPSWVFLEERRP